MTDRPDREALANWCERQAAYQISETAHINLMKCAAALRADLSRACVPDGWQLFSTAPKDGTPILCYHPDNVFSPVTGIDVIWWEPSIRHWTQDGDNKINFLHRPTHWQLLPATPTPPETVAETIQESDGDTVNLPAVAREGGAQCEGQGSPHPSDPNERRTALAIEVDIALQKFGAFPLEERETVASALKATLPVPDRNEQSFWNAIKLRDANINALFALLNTEIKLYGDNTEPVYSGKNVANILETIRHRLYNTQVPDRTLPSADAIKQAVIQILHDDNGEHCYPIYQTQDDNGLEECDYIQFALDLFAALSTTPTGTDAGIREAFAWVVEAGWLPASEPKYLANFEGEGDGLLLNWSKDPFKAIRFSREKDAKIIAKNFVDRDTKPIAYRIAEHGFTDATLAQFPVRGDLEGK